MHFYIGQRVVCVDVKFSDEPLWRSCVRAFPRLNSIYLIRDIRNVHELVGLCFHEIVNAPADFAEGYVEAAFDSRRFRPVRTTNIEIFKALLITDRVGSRRQRELV
jgi:hypothetical protein